MQAALDRETSSNAYSFSRPIELRVQELIAGVRADVGISLYGDDLDSLTATADEIAAVLETIPGAADVGTEQVAGASYLKAKINATSSPATASTARDVSTWSSGRGIEVDEVFEGQRRFPLRVRIAPDWRTNLDAIRHIKVADARRPPDSAEQLAELSLEDGPAQISRDAVRRRTLIQCNVRGRDLADSSPRPRPAVDEKVKLPTGYSLAWGGQFKNLQDAAGRLAIAVPVALFLIIVTRCS